MYSLTDVDGKAKGVNKNGVKNIEHEEFLHVLFNKKNNET